MTSVILTLCTLQHIKWLHAVGGKSFWLQLHSCCLVMGYEYYIYTLQSWIKSLQEYRSLVSHRVSSYLLFDNMLIPLRAKEIGRECSIEDVVQHFRYKHDICFIFNNLLLVCAVCTRCLLDIWLFIWSWNCWQCSVFSVVSANPDLCHRQLETSEQFIANMYIILSCNVLVLLLWLFWNHNDEISTTIHYLNYVYVIVISTKFNWTSPMQVLCNRFS